MLQDFPAETAAPRAKKEPPKLEGFYSEKARALDKLLAKDKELAAKQAAAAQKALPSQKRDASAIWAQAARHAAAGALRKSQLSITALRSQLALTGLSSLRAADELRKSQLGLDALRRSMAFAAPVLTVLAAIALAAVAIASWRSAPATASIQAARESTESTVVALPAAPGTDMMLPAQPQAKEPVEEQPQAVPEIKTPLPVRAQPAPLAVIPSPAQSQPVRTSSIGNPTLNDAQPVATSLQARLGAAVDEPPPVQTLQPARVSPVAAAPPAVRQPIDSPAERLEVAPIVTAQRPADPTPAIRDVIRRYEAAYERLDASAAKDIWPSLDERALARAFAGLSSQTLTLNPCTIDVNGSSAVASCRGFATYVGRVGNKMNQVQRRDWTFELRKSTDNWQIRSVRSN